MPTAVIPVPWFPSNMMSGASVTSQHQEIMLTQYPFHHFNPYPSPFQRGPPMGSFPAQSSLDTVDAKRCSSYETKMANPKYRWGQFCHQGKQRGLAINISFESYQRLISSPCHYCSQCPSESRIGVDRVSSNLNYDISNCVPCCARCNFMKGSLGYREFIEHTVRNGPLQECSRRVDKFVGLSIVHPERVHFFDRGAPQTAITTGSARHERWIAATQEQNHAQASTTVHAWCHYAR